MIKSSYSRFKVADKTQFTFYFFMVVIILWIGVPVGWTLITSFKPRNAIYAYPPIYIPNDFTLFHYQVALRAQTGFLNNIINSITVASATSIITLFISLTAGYGLAKLRGWWGNLPLAVILGSRIIPPISLLVPYMLIVNRLGLTDTYLGIVAAHTFFVGPFTIWMMQTFFRSIPETLEEAAKIDGSSKINTYFRIYLPLVKAGLVATVIISFLWSWKEFLFAFTISREKTMTLPVGLAKFLQDDFISWGALSAGTSLTFIPAVIFVIFFHKQLMEGLIASTGLKE
jgi:multiple sugar transport system permease protein